MTEETVVQKEKPSFYTRKAFDDIMGYIESLEERLGEAKEIISGQNADIQKLLRTNFTMAQKLHEADPSVVPLFPSYAKDDPKEITDGQDNAEADPKPA